MAVASVVAVVLSVLPRSASATPFTFTHVNVPGSNETDATGINNTGQIVGFFFDALSVSHGFIDTGNTYTAITFPGTPTLTQGVNDSGLVVGEYNSAGNFSTGTGTQAYVYNSSTLAFTPFSFTGATSTQAHGINDAGQIVGGYFNGSGNFNNVTGVHGFLRDSGGTFISIDDPNATVGTEAVGINDAGNVVGAYHDATGLHGFLDVGGVFSTIDVPLALDTIIGGINNAGEMEGAYVDASLTLHNFIDIGGVFTTVDNPFGPFSTLGGINDAGQFVGAYDTATTTRGFLATPTTVPEPATLTLTGLGLAGIVRRYRRQRSQ